MFQLNLRLKAAYLSLKNHIYHCTIHNSKLHNQLRCPSMDEWINKMQHIYTTEYSSVTKKNEIVSFAGKWIELEIIVLSEKSQTH
jgi:hypothetical protein